MSNQNIAPAIHERKGYTPGPWHLCQHLKGMKEDQACSCGYRGVIFGPENGVAMAICQPGHEPAPEGQEGTEPARYPREVELANARLIASAPELLEALKGLLREVDEQADRNGWSDRGQRARARAAIAKATGHG